MSRRTGPTQLQALREELAGRDYAVVSFVAEHHLVSGRQLARLFFPDEQFASAATAARVGRRVLERLVAERCLARLQRRIGGLHAGSAGYLYVLGPVGHRLLRRSGARPRLRQPSRHHALHTLAVSELVVDLTVIARLGSVEVTSLQAEPGCWRSLTGIGGEHLLLKPDLFVAVARGDYEYRWFVELDRGQEHLPTLLRKCAAYERYYRSGIEQAAHGVFPRVLWLMPTTALTERLAAAIAADHRLTSGLFIVRRHDQAMATLAGSQS